MRIAKTVAFFLLLLTFLFQPSFSAKKAASKAKPAKKVEVKQAPVKKLDPVPDLGHVGELVYVEGNVTAQRAKAPEWLTAYKNMPDYLLDKIKTDSKSKSTLEFRDGTQVGIGKETEVFIDTETSVKDITKRTLLKRVILRLGTVWCKVTKQEADESFTVETQGGVLGVRGTEFVVSTIGDKKMEVYVLEGTVMTGPSVDQLTQAIQEGEDATIQDGKIEFIKKVELGRNVANTGIYIADHFVDVPWEVGFGVNTLANALEADDMGTFVANEAIDYAKSYDPTGISGFIPGLHIGGGPPPQPQNLQPQGMVNTYTPTFTWEGISNARQYEVVLSKSMFRKDMAKSDLAWIARVDKTSVTYPDTAAFLSPNATYFWVVEGLDENGKKAGRVSSPVTFTLAGEDVLGKRDLYPALLHPLNENAANQLPTFSWNPMKGAASYKVLISSRLKNDQLDSDFAVATLDSKTTQASYSLKDQPLEPGKTYYWSVISLTDKGQAFTNPGPPASFTLPPADKIGPTPVYPVDMVKLTSPFRLEWRGWLSDVSSYHVIISESPDLSQPLLQQDSTTPWLDVADPGAKLSSGKTYYWSVVPLSLEGKPGPHGPVASFSVAP